MTDNEPNTSNDQKLALFRQLQQDGLILHMSLQGTSFKKLTVIDQVSSSDNNQSLFAVSCPKGYQDAVEGLGEKSFDFTFIDKNGIPSRFTTTGGKIIKGNRLLFKIPATVEQRHRRRHFRIKMPAGAYLTARADGQEKKLAMIDVSQGGALITGFGDDRKQKQFEDNQELTDLSLNLLTSGEEVAPVSVRRAEIKRVVFEKNTESFYYGLMFKEITKSENLRLKERIYVNQRQMLRKSK